jgi:hypothetical protein
VDDSPKNVVFQRRKGVRVREDERQSRLDRLRECIKQGEDAYDQLYEPRTHANPAGHYSDAKDFFSEAIVLARELGLQDQAEELSQRIAHIKNVYRSQFAGFDSSPLPSASSSPEPEHPSVDMATELVRLIRENAALVIRTVQPLIDFEFGYNSQSIEWLDGYIEQIRTQPTTESETQQLVMNLGSFLGEAIIAAHGGAWAFDEYGWHIRFDARNRAYPLSKVAKQFQNGAEDSIFGFYSTIPLLFGRSS